MRQKIRLSLVSLGAALVVLVSFSGGMAAAANTAGGNGLRVSPVTTNLTIKPGTSQTVTVNVTNVTNNPATLQAIINDFTASPDESGNPAIILNGQNAPSHSLKQFVQPVSNFNLAPGQEIGVPVRITIPKGTAGGGYYGVVRFGPASVNPTSNQNVLLAGSVGSLILVDVPGKIVEHVSIASFDVRSKNVASSFFTTHKNLTATIRFQNEGNLQEAPFGKVLLRNRSGKILGTYEVNAVYPPGNVLPDSIRRFTVPLKNVGSFGIFKVEGNFGYGTTGQLLSASTTFYVVPYSVMIIFVLIVLFLVFLVFGLPRLVRGYNRRVIRKAGRR